MPRQVLRRNHLCFRRRTGHARITRPARIPHGGSDPDGKRDREEHRTKSPPTETWHISDLLRDHDLKRVDGTEGCANEGGANAHRDRDDRREPQSARERNEDGNERDDLFLHVLDHATGREKQADHRYDEQLPAASLGSTGA